MYGGIVYQVNRIFEESGIKQFGQSKHRAKEEARKNITPGNKGLTWHQVGKQIGIYSHNTGDAYRSVWKQLGKYVKAEYRLKDLEKLEGKHIQSFLEKKISDNVQHKTFTQYVAAIEKLESALNGFSKHHETGEKYNFSQNIKHAKIDGHKMLSRFTGSRAYNKPLDSINKIENWTHKLTAKIQLESGARVSECQYLEPKNLKGFVFDKATGEKKGVLYIENAKGGINGYKYLPEKTYNELEKSINGEKNKTFSFSISSYRKTLKEVFGKEYQGSGTHGLRWNFAQDRFKELQNFGQTYNQSLQQVSNELFHQRADITEHYLK